MKNKKSLKIYIYGLRDGIPIGLGYMAVAFSLGITAGKYSLNALQGFLASLFTIASAGEYAAFLAIGAGASYVEMAIIILVANCRYILMSTAMSQRIDPQMPFAHRFGIGGLITDEIFGVSMAHPGYLSPAYIYGLASVSVLPWALGTSLGIIMGNILPSVVVGALGVSIYGMFLAIIIPPARKEKRIAIVVLCSFASSLIWKYIPFINELSSGIKIIVLTILLSVMAAIIFPRNDQQAESEIPNEI